MNKLIKIKRSPFYYLSKNQLFSSKVNCRYYKANSVYNKVYDYFEIGTFIKDNRMLGIYFKACDNCSYDHITDKDAHLDYWYEFECDPSLNDIRTIYHMALENIRSSKNLDELIKIFNSRSKNYD